MDKELRALAQDLLDIQHGSREDAIDLLDMGYPLTGEERDKVINHINDLSEEPND